MKFFSIQIFRALAANAVVISHLHGIEEKYGKGWVLLPDWTGVAGPAGVHFFFVISGFVMIFAADGQNWREFIVARIARIYPIYWLYTSIVVALVLLTPGSISFSLPPFQSLVKSYLLWPDTVGTLLPVGWSLVFEMHFYLTLTLVIALAFPLQWAIPVWAIVITAMMNIIEPQSPLATIALSPLTLEFLAGAAAGLVVKRGGVRYGKVSFVSGIVGLFLGFLRYGPYAQPDDSTLLSVCLLGPPFTLIVYGGVAMEIGGQWRSSRIWILLGDASYSTYLSHIIVLSALGRIFQAVPASARIVEVCFVVFCVASANLFGVASYFGLERPSIKLIHARFNFNRRRYV